MYEVSEKFMSLAMANGRRVFCRIEAGQEVFLDDRIVEFDFDDVVHPDWFTVGTTCANRFAFTVRYNGELAVRDTVCPYISFDGEEWCPLGVFFVARRYVRGQYASIICYDRMYSLDMEYKTTLTAPTDTAAILEDICTRYQIMCEDYGFAHSVAEIPQGCTVRDMIGYIAALERACAKMNRSGALVMKSVRSGNIILEDKNCISIRRNMSRSVFTCIKADTGSGEMIAGDGAEISTLELYNPLLTEESLTVLYRYLRSFSFYGAEIEMQGLPFLEAGDSIQLHENGELYQITASEIEYHYDGSFFATLYSKNRSYTDAAVHFDDLKAALEMLKASYYKFQNERAISLSSVPVIAVDFEFETAGKCFAQLCLDFNVENDSAGELTAEVYINGERHTHTLKHTLNSGTSSLNFCLLTEALPEGKNRIIVTIKTDSGAAQIAENDLHAYIVGHGISGSGGSARDKVTLFEKLDKLRMSDVWFVPRAIDCELNIREE